MELRECETLDILNKNSKLKRSDINTLMYRADTDNDYLVQAYVEHQLMVIHGQNFFKTSQRQIETITYLLANNREDDLLHLYLDSFESFMKNVNNNMDQIMSFNIIMICFIGIGRRLLRLSADKHGGGD